MRFKSIIRMFEDGNVSVCGLRGCGKDLLMSNVVVRRGLPYISNVDYGGQFISFNYSDLNCGENTYKNFLSGNINQYNFPYPDQTDVYLSDAGIYFPAQYCNELNKLYPYMAVYQALSRHVAQANFHTNAQALGRVWDKIREQSDMYILCRRCWYIKGYVFQKITIYDRYQSAVDKMQPLKLPMPFLSNKESRMMRKIQLASYEAAHGSIRNAFLFYKNNSTYDTRQFKKILSEGK